MNQDLDEVTATIETENALPDQEGYELIDGELREKQPLGIHSSIFLNELGRIIGNFCKEHRLGWVCSAEGGFRCFPDRPKLVRKPDVAFIQRDRLPFANIPKGELLIAPDLVVEIVSPNDLYEEVEQKVAEYRSAGVRLIWIVSPGNKTIVIRRLDGSAAEVNESGLLSGEDVLPGFSYSVAELFRLD